MWVKDIFGSYVNLDKVDELRVTSTPTDYKLKGHTVVEACIGSWEYYLFEIKHNEADKHDMGVCQAKAELFIIDLIRRHNEQ